MPKIEIDVDQILTSAVPLEIEAGDHLLVMNGVVVGMVEKRARRPTVEARPPAPTRAKRQKPSFFAPADIMDVLRKTEQPMTAREIIEMMQLGRDEPFPNRDRDAIAKVLRHLHEQRKIGVADEAERYSRYRLLP